MAFDSARGGMGTTVGDDRRWGRDSIMEKGRKGGGR